MKKLAQQNKISTFQIKLDKLFEKLKLLKPKIKGVRPIDRVKVFERPLKHFFK